MMKELIQTASDCPECGTVFKKGDLVYCLVDPLYLTESVFDCGRFNEDIGIVIGISFYKHSTEQGFFKTILCELEIHWANANTTSCHLDKYISKVSTKNT